MLAHDQYRLQISLFHVPAQYKRPILYCKPYVSRLPKCVPAFQSKFWHGFCKPPGNGSKSVVRYPFFDKNGIESSHLITHEPFVMASHMQSPPGYCSTPVNIFLPNPNLPFHCHGYLVHTEKYIL